MPVAKDPVGDARTFLRAEGVSEAQIDRVFARLSAAAFDGDSLVHAAGDTLGEILSELGEAEGNADRKFGFEWARDGLRAQTDATTLSPDQAKAYVGNYGPRKISFRVSTLHIVLRFQKNHWG